MMDELVSEWQFVQLRKHGFILKGHNTLFAGDGLVIPIKAITNKESIEYGLSKDVFFNSLATNTLIIMVCAKLHNLSLTDWKENGKSSEDILQEMRNLRAYNSDKNVMEKTGLDEIG